MGAVLATVEKHVKSDFEDLHEFLWGGKAMEPAALGRRLARTVREIDRATGAGGALAKNAIRLVSPPVKDGTAGAKFFTLVETIGYLAIARDAFARKRYEKCAAHAFGAIGNLSIALLSSAGRFDVVDEHEHKGADAKVYMEKAVDALTARGAKTADRWMRLYLLAHGGKEAIPQIGDKDSQRLAANMVLALGGAAPVRFNAIGRELGTLDEEVFGDFPKFAALAVLGKK